MADKIQFESFDEFYPFYLSQHSKPATRILHAAGTGLALLNLAKSLAVGPRKQALASPVIGYGFAWFAHFVIEKNTPATFGHPVWSLRGDFTMLTDMVRGRNGELQLLADDYAELMQAQAVAASTAEVFFAEHPAGDSQIQL
jgi:hypothetical protein